jgi:hypothetical protein
VVERGSQRFIALGTWADINKPGTTCSGSTGATPGYHQVPRTESTAQPLVGHGDFSTSADPTLINMRGKQPIPFLSSSPFRVIPIPAAVEPQWSTFDNPKKQAEDAQNMNRFNSIYYININSLNI